LAALGLLVAVCLTTRVEAREITDMYGRHFRLPDRSLKVYSASPPDTFLLYAIDPTLLAGLNFPIKAKDKCFMHRHTLTLPIIGGTFGEASIPNLEMLLRVNPDLVVVSNNETSLSLTVNETLKKLNKPLVEMTLVGLDDYPAAFLRMGKLLDRESRARKLSDYTRKTLSEAAKTVAALPPGKRVSVYYAEGVDGLRTECDTSRHNELIALAGGINVHHCEARSLFGMEQVSMEQVLLYDPEVLLVMDKGFYRRVFHDPKWKRIKAVRQKRVYLIPDQPSNWFDRPPTFMRLIGLKWLLNRIYPHEFRVDMEKEAQKFYRLFLGVEPSRKEIRKILHR
jgi:iron complex transport system substrate-binding protein